MDLEKLAAQYRDQKISGNELGNMVKSGSITKSQRRKITKLGLKPKIELSARQLLRLQVKEKKMQPKLTKDERRYKYVEGKLELERDMLKSKHIVCLGCRESGHLLKYCPLANQPNQPHQKAQIICFNCGATDHPLRACPHERSANGELPFASCFICKGKGHISKDCPQNTNGLYPHGGCCHICLEKSHLVKDCPKKQLDVQEAKEKASEITLHITDGNGGDDLDNYAELVQAVDDDDDEDGVNATRKKKGQKSKRK